MIIGIVAVDANNGIGIDGKLPWPKLKEDLAWFKSQTENNIVVMGSTTWKSIGSKPLPNRINCVVSRHYYDNANYTFLNPKYAVEFCNKIYPRKHTFVIGGQQIYDSTMDLIDKWLITEIKETYKTDKSFDLKYVIKNFPNREIKQTFEAFDNTPAFDIIEYTK